MLIAAREADVGVVNSGRRKTPPDAPYFALEMNPGEAGGPVFAAAVCSEEEGPGELEVRRYALGLLHEFFRRREEVVRSTEPRFVLRNAFRHIHRHILEKYGGEGPRLDLLLVLAYVERLHAARCGGNALFLFSGDRAESLFPAWDREGGLLGDGAGERVEIRDTPLEPGDVVVLCNPPLARVLGARDVGVILRRAREAHKAALFLSAIASRKGAQGVQVALVWEVPNYRGAAMLAAEATQEETTPSPGQPGEGVEEAAEELPAEEDHAEKAKRQWLSKWRRRREE
ncbi:MAG: hypothetical protein ACUVS1_06765 [Actinomycetota bacterium]